MTDQTNTEATEAAAPLSFEIETVEVASVDSGNSDEQYANFLVALKNLSPGTGFKIPKSELKSTYRNAIALAEVFLDATFQTKKIRGTENSLVSRIR